MNNASLPPALKEQKSYSHKYNPITTKWEGDASYTDPLTVFGERLVAVNEPVIQCIPARGVNPPNMNASSSGSGNAIVSANEMKVTSGLTQGSKGEFMSKRFLNYRAGEGGLVRFAARFPDNAEGCKQSVGAFNKTDELSFGYDGTQFGIWHKHHGLVQTGRLVVTVAASSSENATFEIDGVEYTIPLTDASGDTAYTANEIATWLNDNVDDISAEQNGQNVVFWFNEVGNKSGSNSFSSSSAFGFVVIDQSGRDQYGELIPQEDWSCDTFEELDPTKGNVYQINYQYLGYGAIIFSIEDPADGVLKPVHILQQANSNTATSLGNPSFNLGLQASNPDAASNATIYCSSIAGFRQGVEVPVENPISTHNTKAVPNGTYINLLTIRNKGILGDALNGRELQPLFLGLASENDKNVIIELRENATTSDNRNFDDVSGSYFTDVDVASDNVSGGRSIVAVPLQEKGSKLFDLSPYRARISPSSTLSVVAYRSGGSDADVTATLTWYEDV
jgi:hypothetical protein